MEFNSRMTKVSEIANDSIFQELEFDELNGIKSGEIFLFRWFQQNGKL